MPHLASSPIEQAVCSRFYSKLLLKARSSRDRELFLRSDLTKLFNKDSVNALLKCSCPDCLYWRDITNAPHGFSETHSKQIVGESTSWHSGQQKKYVIILSLLVYVRWTPLIFRFLQKKLSDELLQGDLGKLSPEILRADILPKDFGDESVNLILRLIDQHKYKFFVPNVDSFYGDFVKEVIFPFLDETEIGSGGYGTVYSFHIPTEYIKFEINWTEASYLQDLPHTGRFARKVFTLGTDIGKSDFEREVQNLEKVMKIGGTHAHPHLMRYHKAFKHGNFGVIIFPLAESNLRTVLESPDTIFPGFLDHPFWDQLLRISEALENLHSFNVREAERNGCLYGYHFDLKPANILVGFDGNFIISDFGQAYFLHPENGVYVENSVARGRGGDTSYAPPENEDRHLVDNEHLENTRKYDIWSLGCIFLEVIWFIMKGSKGVSELYDIRTEQGNWTDDRFYYLDGRRNAHLKHDLWHKTRNLMNLAPLGISRVFVENIIGLTFKMLVTNRHDRHAANQVVENLSTILEMRNATSFETSASGSAIEPRLGESGNNNTQPSFFVNGQFKIEGKSHRGKLSLEKHGRRLNMSFLRNGKCDLMEMGEALELHLLPFYALHQPPHPHRHRFSDSDFVILPKPGYLRNRFPAQFKLSSLQDSQDLHGKLLGQKIMYHKELMAASFQICEKKAKKRSVKPDNPEQAGAVQIWCLDKGLKLNDPPQHSYDGPTPRRIVVYMYKSIYFFEFDSTFRICKETEGTQILEWKPKEPSYHPFNGLVLNCLSDQEGPGIPMDAGSLEQGKMKFELIRLTFKTLEDSASFRKSYKSEKEKWSNQQKYYQSHRREIAQLNGFDRN